MSRVGRKPIKIPKEVVVNVTRGSVEVSGPKGKLSKPLPEGIDVAVEGDEVRVSRRSDGKKSKSLHGLTRGLVANMVQGTSAGFTISLDIVGTGYRVEEADKNTLKLSIGYSNPVEFKLPEGIKATIEERGTRLIVEGIDKELVGEVSARIRKLRPPDPYKGKGLRYTGEVLRIKAGKAGVSRGTQ
ncbi:MAG: 50S ribosomal protein L6 [Thermodesulfobacteriota bacterium]